MRDTILILTNTEDDLHTKPVIDKLLLADQKVFRFDVDLMTSGKTHINVVSIDNCIEFVIISCCATVASNYVKSVWYRRPSFFNLQIKDVIQKQQAEEEILSCLEGVWLTLSNSFWVSNPHSIERARKKVYQLSLASKIGFTIPKTIITNNPIKVKSFFDACDGKIIYKTLKQSYFDYSEKSYNIPTTLITPQHLEKIELIQTTPSFFQEQLDKSYEVRVTVVGQTVFAVKIDSQAYEATKIDWRNPAYIDKLDYKIINLPKIIQYQCQQIVQELGLNFGAIDLVVNLKGEYIFLEINPNGQWQWLEYFTGINISGAIADMLVKC